MSDESYLQWLDINWVKENSSISNNLGLPFTDRFMCLLNIENDEGVTPGWLALQALSIEVPSFGIEPVEHELNGARRIYFKGRTDSEMSITFLERPDLPLRRFFYNWMQRAIEVNHMTGVTRNYMETYICPNFFIFPLDYIGKATYSDSFMNVVPYEISGISYNYSQAGEVLKTVVKFKYMYHYMTQL